jgi:hypothetical protein
LHQLEVYPATLRLLFPVYYFSLIPPVLVFVMCEQPSEEKTMFNGGNGQQHLTASWMNNGNVVAMAMGAIR